MRCMWTNVVPTSKLAPGPGPNNAQRSRSTRPDGGRRQRDGDLEDRPTPARPRRRGAAVRGRDRGHDRQTQPDAAARTRTGGVGAEEALEDAVELPGSDSRPRVLHDEPRRAVRRGDLHLRGCRCRRVRTHVAQQVVDDPTQPLAVAEYDGGLYAEL